MRMNPFYYISATIEIVGALIALTLIISLLLERSARGRLGRIFLSMLICNGACLINDALFWIFVGRPEKYAGAIARVTVFATYAISYIFLPLFIYYALTLIRQSRPASYGVAHASAAVCAVAFISLAVSQFNNMYYYFDAQNRYYRGPFFAYSQSVFIFFAVAVAIVIFRYRKALGFRNALCLLS